MVVCVHFAGFVGDIDEGAVLHAGFDETHFGVCVGRGGGSVGGVVWLVGVCE